MRQRILEYQSKNDTSTKNIKKNNIFLKDKYYRITDLKYYVTTVRSLIIGYKLFGLFLRQYTRILPS